MPSFTTRPEIRGTFGVVASTHWIASAVGMSIFEKGGNAFDAAAAAGFTLQVVEPHLNGPLGEAPMLVWDEASRRCEMICGQGVAPAAATIDKYRELGLELIPGTGLLAAAVPAAFGAWMRLLRDHGTMPLGEILGPAIGYAQNGYPAVRQMGMTVATVAELFRREWPSSAAVYLPNGAPPQPGRLFRNPALAATYRRVLAEAGDGGRDGQIERARNAWYSGFVAEAVDRFCRREKVLDVSGRRHGGLLTGDDMAGWDAPVEAPVTFDYRGYTVAKGGPWSQGPVLLQQLALLQGFDLDDLNPLGPDFVHLVVECAKLAFADREAWYGDPDFVDVPMRTLLSDDYNDTRRKLIGDHASLDLRPGSPDGRAARVLVGGLEMDLPGPGIGEPTVTEHGLVAGDTCHLDVIDRWGNMVSATPSGGWLQSSPVIPELGFCLGTRMQMFWLEEGLPASLAPGRRPRSTLSPSMAFRDGEPYLAFGTPGGDQQDQWSRLDVPASPAPRHEPAGGDRLPGVSHRAHAELVLPARRAAGHRGAGEPVSGSDLRRIDAARPSSAGRRGVVRRPPLRLRPRRHRRRPGAQAAANPRGMQGYAVGR